jgi:ribosomal protein S27AE
MALTLPDEHHRWRCGHCGNLTRFDVVRRARTREYWHVDLAGAPEVEGAETLEEQIDEVSCRRCGNTDRIEVISRPEPGHEGDSPHDVGGV